MLVSNFCSFALKAFGWAEPYGYADDVLIPVGETREVNGPYIGQMGGGSCHVALTGEFTCQNQASVDTGVWMIAPGMSLTLRAGDRGITIRHHEDEPEEKVLLWRQARPGKESEEELDDDTGM